jgi:LysM repeat protein
MSSHRPTRWLAPVALIAASLAVTYVVTSYTGDGAEDRPAASSPQERQAEEEPSGTTTSTTQTPPATTDEDGGEEQGEASTSTTPSSEARTYTVRPGDTFGTIAERTGVSVEQLQELNPTTDPQALTVGEEIRLTEE